MNHRWRIGTGFGVLLALVVVAVQFGRPGTAEGTILMLRQEADSALYVVSWVRAQNATHYRLDVSTEGLELGSSETEDPQVADSVWIPLAEERGGEFCVRAIARRGNRERVSDPACATTTLPEALPIPDPPGGVDVTPLGDVIAFMDSLVVYPREINIEVGEEVSVRAVAWMADIPTVCAVLESGTRGWVEINDPEAEAISFPTPARYVEDAECGLEWRSEDESVVTVEPEPYTMPDPELELMDPQA